MRYDDNINIENKVEYLLGLNTQACYQIARLLKSMPRNKLTKPAVKQVKELFKTNDEFLKDLMKDPVNSRYEALLANRAVYLQIIGSLLNMFSITCRENKLDVYNEMNNDYIELSRDFINVLEIQEEQKKIHQRRAKINGLANLQK